MPALLGVQRSKPSLLGRTSPLAALKVTPPSVDTYSEQVPAWKSPSETRTLVGSEGSTAMAGMLSRRPRLWLSCVTQEFAVTWGKWLGGGGWRRGPAPRRQERRPAGPTRRRHALGQGVASRRPRRGLAPPRAE